MHQRTVGIAVPQPVAHIGAVEAFTRHLPDLLPAAEDIAGDAHGVNQTEGGPQRRIAAEQGAVGADRAQNGEHPLPVGFHCGCTPAVPPAERQRAPVVGVQLEIVAFPLLFHMAEYLVQVVECLRMGGVEYVPRSAPPAAEGDIC